MCTSPLRPAQQTFERTAANDQLEPILTDAAQGTNSNYAQEAGFAKCRAVLSIALHCRFKCCSFASLLQSFNPASPEGDRPVHKLACQLVRVRIGDYQRRRPNSLVAVARPCFAVPGGSGSGQMTITFAIFLWVNKSHAFGTHPDPPCFVHFRIGRTAGTCGITPPR